MDDRAAKFTTREAVENELERTHEALEKIFANFTPEMLEDEQAAMGLHMCAMHAFAHAGQIDYIQTCWGDQENHFPS